MNNKEKLPVPPPLKTDEAAERFVDQADLTRYDLSRFRSMNFEFEKKTARVNMRLPEPLLRAVKAKAQTRGIPYQRLIREAIERALEDDSA
jgi:predicted DNA binding CopG/RHH family protein